MAHSEKLAVRILSLLLMLVRKNNHQRGRFRRDLRRATLYSIQLSEWMAQSASSFIGLIDAVAFHKGYGNPASRLIAKAWATSRNTATSIMTSSRGFEIMPRETISVVAPAGGWLTSRRTMNAPVAESERAAARILGQKIPGCTPNGSAPAPVATNAA